MKTTIILLLTSTTAITHGNYAHPKGCSSASKQVGIKQRGNRLELECESRAGTHIKVIYLSEVDL